MGVNSADGQLGPLPTAINGLPVSIFRDIDALSSELVVWIPTWNVATLGYLVFLELCARVCTFGAVKRLYMAAVVEEFRLLLGPSVNVLSMESAGRVPTSRLH